MKPTHADPEQRSMSQASPNTVHGFDADPDGVRSILREFRTARGPRPLTGAALTFALALLFAGIGLVLGAAVENIFGGQARLLGIRDEEAMVGLSLGALAWLIALVYIWKPVIGRSFGARPSWRIANAPLLSCGIVLAIGAGAIVAVDQFGVRGDDHLMIGIVGMVAGAILLLWSPNLMRIDRRFVSTTPQGKIDLRCPQCDYSMVGLREARCPECGAAFTVDELVRLQR